MLKKERSFYFDYTSKESGTRYEGSFTIKCKLNVRERYSLELEKNKLYAGYENPTEELFGLALVLSTLRTKIIVAPNWFLQGNGIDIEDEDALVNLYYKVEEESNIWKNELFNQLKDSPEGK